MESAVISRSFSSAADDGPKSRQLTVPFPSRVERRRGLIDSLSLIERCELIDSRLGLAARLAQFYTANMQSHDRYISVITYNIRCTWKSSWIFRLLEEKKNEYHGIRKIKIVALLFLSEGVESIVCPSGSIGLNWWDFCRRSRLRLVSRISLNRKTGKKKTSSRRKQQKSIGKDCHCLWWIVQDRNPKAVIHQPVPWLLQVRWASGQRARRASEGRKRQKR